MQPNLFVQFSSEDHLMEYVEKNPEWYKTVLLPYKTEDKRTALHAACFYRCQDLVFDLVRDGLDVNAKNEHGVTPLHFAAMKCANFVCQFLISKGADVSAMDESGLTPLMCALKEGNFETSLYLAEQAQLNDARDEIQRNSLHLAALNGIAGACYHLVKKGFDINAQDTEGNTPLHLAVLGKHRDTTKNLIELKADLTVRNHQGQTPAMLAITIGDLKILYCFKKLGDPQLASFAISEISFPGLPEFRFHPNPLKTGSIVIQDGFCHSCEKEVACLYTGSFYANNLEERISLCPWCIADGSAAQKFKLKFSFIDYKVQPIAEDLKLEIEERTPGFYCWQEKRWLVCCNQPCTYLGQGGLYEMQELGEAALNALKQAVLQDNGFLVDIEEQQDYLANLGTLDEGGSTAYFFQCSTCKQYHAFSDFG